MATCYPSNCLMCSPFVEYCARRFADRMLVGEHKKVCQKEVIAAKCFKNKLNYVEALLDHCDVKGGDRDRVLEKVRAAMTKMQKKATKKAYGEAAEGEATEEEYEAEEDVEKLAPSALADLTPAELSFLAKGVGPCGAGLMEEETDRGLDEMASMAAKKPAVLVSPPVKVTPAPAAPIVVSGSGASSSGGPAPSAGPCMVAEEAGVDASPPAESGAGVGALEEAGPVPAGGAAVAGAESGGDVDAGAEVDEGVREAMVAVAALRAPAAAVEEAPPGCSCRRYDPGPTAKNNNSFWEARLPKGIRYTSPTSLASRNARRRDYAPGFRTSEKARRECLDWLWGAKAANLI